MMMDVVSELTGARYLLMMDVVSELTGARYLLMMGVVSELTGVLSAMMIWKTEKTSSTVMPSDTFSPQLGGSQNMMSVMLTIDSVGMTML